MLQPTLSFSKRSHSRIKPSEDIWVYWRCGERADVSRVQDISLGGLFVEEAKLWLLGSSAEVDFLVQEGQIRAEAVVKHVESGRGLGLKFIALHDQDRPHLIALMQRLRSLRAA